MGLSTFPSASEGVLPVLVLNTVLSMALLKNMMISLLQVMGSTWSSTFTSNASSNLDIIDDESDVYPDHETTNARLRRISITQFKSLCHHRYSSVECCVCLCGFEADEEVSELSCKHFFHKGCLDKWFNNKHSTCPLCRSIH